MCFSNGIVYPIEKKTLWKTLMEKGVHSRGSGFVETNSTKGKRLPYTAYVQQVSEARNLQKLWLTWAAQVGRLALPCNPSFHDEYLWKSIPKYPKIKPSKAELKIYRACWQMGFFFPVYLFFHSIETRISNCLFPFTKYSESHNWKVLK